MKFAQTYSAHFSAWLLPVIFLVPWAAVQIPPLVDLYQHAIRLFLVGYVPEGDPLWSYFEFGWVFTPNLGFDLIFYAFSRLLPFEIALGTAIFFTLALMAGSLFALSLTLNGRVTVGAVLASAMFFSWPFQMGFLNYTVSVAGAFLAFALHQRLKEAAFVRHALLLVPASLIVWISHISGWGVLGLLVAGAEIAGIRSADDRCSYSTGDPRA